MTVLAKEDCVPGASVDFLAAQGLLDVSRTIVGGPGNAGDAVGQLQRC